MCSLKPSFIFSHPNPTSTHIISHGIFEKELIKWCEQFMTLDGDFIDIGAHSGTYALSLAPHCRHVFAFEAQRMTYYQLCGGISLNHYKNVFPIHCALGSEVSTMTLNITSKDGGGSTLDASIPSNQKLSLLDQETCNVKPLDLFFDSGIISNKIKLIKIDVEGWELNVLKGATKTLKSNNYPPILFEAWPDEFYKTQKQNLFQYISTQLPYKIQPAPHSNNMFIAIKQL